VYTYLEHQHGGEVAYVSYRGTGDGGALEGALQGVGEHPWVPGERDRRVGISPFHFLVKLWDGDRHEYGWIARDNSHAHDSRVLFSALSPNGGVLMTGAGDENLKFWRIWDSRDVKGKKKTVGKKEEGGARGILRIQ